MIILPVLGGELGWRFVAFFKGWEDEPHEDDRNWVAFSSFGKALFAIVERGAATSDLCKEYWPLLDVRIFRALWRVQTCTVLILSTSVIACSDFITMKSDANDALRTHSASSLTLGTDKIKGRTVLAVGPFKPGKISTKCLWYFPFTLFSR